MGTLKEEIYQALTECENIKEPEKLMARARDLVILAKYSGDPDLIATFYILYTMLKEFGLDLGEFRDLIHELKSYFVNDDYASMLIVVKNFLAKKVREW
jgi:hypothetical protein